MIRFASLGSGSRGNATIIESGHTRLLVDCGFGLADTEKRLARLGVAPDTLSAILVTHEHGDHIAGVAKLARRHGIQVYLTAGTAAAWKEADKVEWKKINCHQPFSLKDLEVQPFPVPHDANEPCQYLFHDGQRRLGVLSDTGEITPHIVATLNGCDGLFLECNHDIDLLRKGSYPESLKRRVGGRLGHLNNDQSAALLEAIDSRSLQHVVTGHISEKNNTEELACQALERALDCEPGWVGVAGQENGSDWREIR